LYPYALVQVEAENVDKAADAAVVREALDRELLSIVLAEEPNYLQVLLPSARPLILYLSDVQNTEVAEIMGKLSLVTD
jgi:hypothetical protein